MCVCACLCCPIVAEAMVVNPGVHAALLFFSVPRPLLPGVRSYPRSTRIELEEKEKAFEQQVATLEASLRQAQAAIEANAAQLAAARDEVLK